MMFRPRILSVAVHLEKGGHVVVDAGVAADVGEVADGDEVVHADAAHHVARVADDARGRRS